MEWFKHESSNFTYSYTISLNSQFTAALLEEEKYILYTYYMHIILKKHFELKEKQTNRFNNRKIFSFFQLIN